MPPKASQTIPSAGPKGSLISGLLFLASAAGWFLFEYNATLGYDASQPYDWIVETISDLGVNYRQVHNVKHHNVTSYRASTLNFGLYWNGILSALAQLNLLWQTRKQIRSNVGTLRTVRVILSLVFASGMVLMAQIHGGSREIYWGTVGWHWTGFGLLILAGNLNSIVAALQSRQVGHPDTNLSYRIVSLLLGVAGLASFTKFNMLGEWTVWTQIGIWQRGSLYPIMIWQAATGLGLTLGWLANLVSKDKQV